MRLSRKPGRQPLPKREQEICSRLKQFRESINVTQRDFSSELGISRERLASYEDGRVALRCDLALRICRHFILSEKWLATGKGRMRHVMDLSTEPIPSSVPVDALFSEAYNRFLGGRYEQLFSESKGNLRLIYREGDSFEMMKHLFLYSLSEWLTWFPKEWAPVLFTFLLEQGHDFVTFAVKNKRLPNEGDLANLDTPSAIAIQKTST